MGDPVRDNIELVETAKRRKEVLRLRREGHTYREIAERVEEKWGKDRVPKSWGPRHAHKDVKRELDKYREDLRESVESLVELEVQRIEKLFTTYYPAAREGDKDAAKECRKLMERKAELLGLDEAEEYVISPGEEAFSFGWADPDDAPEVGTGEPESDG